MLFIFAISVLALYFAVSVCWQLLRSILTLPFKVGTETYEHDHFDDDETAIWVKGKNGRCFRYDLEIGARLDELTFSGVDGLNMEDYQMIKRRRRILRKFDNRRQAD